MVRERTEGVGRQLQERQVIDCRWLEPNAGKCPEINVVNGNGVAVWYNEGGTKGGRSTYNDGIEVFG
jgi:hypothetical protein